MVVSDWNDFSGLPGNEVLSLIKVNEAMDIIMFMHTYLFLFLLFLFIFIFVFGFDVCQLTIWWTQREPFARLQRCVVGPVGFTTKQHFFNLSLFFIGGKFGVRYVDSEELWC